MCSEIMAWSYAHISHKGNCREGPKALWGSGSGEKRGRWNRDGEDRRERLGSAVGHQSGLGPGCGLPELSKDG